LFEARYRCADCNIVAPPTDEDSILLSQSFGWRLTRVSVGDGHQVEARCPRCWVVYRGSARAAAGSRLRK
jgi:hypothetical protein